MQSPITIKPPLPNRNTIADFMYKITRVTDKVSVHVGIDAIGRMMDLYAKDTGDRIPPRFKLTDAEEAARWQSYNLGGSDRIMGERIGISSHGFRGWRWRRGLASKGTTGPIPKGVRYAICIDRQSR